MSICRCLNPRGSWELKLSRCTSDALANPGAAAFRTSLATKNRRTLPVLSQSSPPIITCLQMIMPPSHASHARSVTELKDSLGLAAPSFPELR